MPFAAFMGSRKKASKQATVQVRLLDGSTDEFKVDRKISGEQLWSTFIHRSSLQERDFFGLQFDFIEGQLLSSQKQSKKFSVAAGGTYNVKRPVRRWINPLSSIESQLGPPVADTLDPEVQRWEFECRVKFYVDSKVVQLWHPFARYLFYLQLRDNLQCGHIPVTTQTAVTLAGLGSQYQFGDWGPSKVSSSEYLRQVDHAGTRDPNMADAIQALHKSQKGSLPEEVENAFIEVMQSQPMYGVELFTCQVDEYSDAAAGNSTDETCKVGLCPHGINVYRREKARSSKYTWPTIKNLACSKKQLTLTHIDVAARTATVVTLTFESKSACKNVWKRAIELHTFFRGDLDGSSSGGGSKKLKVRSNSSGGGIENMAFAQKSKKKRFARGKKKQQQAKEFDAHKTTLLSAIKNLQPPVSGGGIDGGGGGGSRRGSTRFLQLAGSSGGGSSTSMQTGSSQLQQQQQQQQHRRQASRDSLRNGKGPATTTMVPSSTTTRAALKPLAAGFRAGAAGAADAAGSRSGTNGASASTALGEMKTVVLSRAPTEIFGLTLIGPDQAAEPKGIFISEVIPGSAAAQVSDLAIGCMLVSIDGTDVSAKPLKAAVMLLRSSSGSVVLRIASSGTGWSYHYRKDQEKAATANAEMASSITAALADRSRSSSRASSHNSSHHSSRGPSPLMMMMRDGANTNTTIATNNTAAAAAAAAAAARLPRSSGSSSGGYIRHVEGHGAQLSWVTGRIIVSDEENAVELGPEVMVEAIITVGAGDKLGMSITGGTDDKISEHDDNVYINKLVPGGMAFKNSRLQIADRLVSLNGTTVAAMLHGDAVELIHAALKTGVVHLVVARIVPANEITEQQLFLGQAQSPLYCDAAAEMRYSDLPGYHREQLSCRNNEDGDSNGRNRSSAERRLMKFVTWKDLGITLEGPTKHSAPGGGVFIASVAPGSNAHKCGGIVAGDRLVDVNGWVVDRISLAELQMFPVDLEAHTLKLGVVSDVAFRPVRRTIAIKSRRSSLTHAGLGIQVKATKFGVFVSAVVPNGRADSDGQLKVADELLMLNGAALQGLPERQVIALLATPVLEWHFEVTNNPLRYTYYTNLKVASTTSAAPASATAATGLVALTSVVVTSPYPKSVEAIQVANNNNNDDDDVSNVNTTAALAAAEEGGNKAAAAADVDSDDDALPDLPAEKYAEVGEVGAEADANANVSSTSSYASARSSLVVADDHMILAKTPSPRRSTPVVVRPSTFAGLPCMIRTCAHFGGDASRGQLPFAYADVLEIMGVVDQQWWFAFDRLHNRYGKVPSLSALNDISRIGALIRRDTSFEAKDSYLPVTYATAGSSAKSTQRPVLIVGAHAGTISACFARLGPDAGVSVVQPAQYTSRPKRPDEVEGKQYHFVSQQYMDDGVRDSKFVHVGRFNDALYGVPSSVVVELATSGKVPLLEKLSAKAVERFQQQTGVYPIVICVQEESVGGGNAAATAAAHGYDSVVTETVVFKSMRDTAIAIAKLVVARQEEQRTWQKDDSAFLPHLPAACGITEIPEGAATATTTTTTKAVAEGEAAADDDDADAAVLRPARDLNSLKIGVPITTRAPRDVETDGKDYHFITTGEFRTLADADRLDQWGVNAGHYYGTLKVSSANDAKPRPMLRSRTFAAALKSNTIELPPLDPANSAPSPMKSVLLSVNATDTFTAGAADGKSSPSLKQMLKGKRDEQQQQQQQQLAGSLAAIAEDGTDSNRHSFISSMASESIRSSMCYSDSSADFSDCSARSGAESASMVDSICVSAPDEVLNRVTLARNAQGSFGFTLTEGALWSVPCISHIKKLNVVSSNLLGDVSQGDYILAINDVSLAGQPHDETIALLRNSEHVVDLLLLPNGGIYEESILVQDLDTSSAVLGEATNLSMSMSLNMSLNNMGASRADDSVAADCTQDMTLSEFVPQHPLGVVLQRQDAANGGGFGFSIVGCEKEGAEHLRPGVFISRVTVDSPAYQSGMQVGMRVLTVNGVDITTATWEVATDALLGVDEQFSMVLRSELDAYRNLNQTHEASQVLNTTLLGTNCSNSSGGGGGGRRSTLSIGGGSRPGTAQSGGGGGGGGSFRTMTPGDQDRGKKELIWLTDVSTVLIKKDEGQLLGMRLAVEAATGVRVIEVRAGGAAASSEIVADCMIRMINGKDVAGCDYEEIRELLKPKELFLTVEFPSLGEKDDEREC